MRKIRVLLIGGQDNLLLEGLIVNSALISNVDIIDLSAIINLEHEVLAEISRVSENFFKAADIVFYIADPAGFSIFANMAMEFKKPFVASTNSYKIINKGTILQISGIIPCALIKFDSNPEIYVKKLAKATILAFEENPGLYVLTDG